MSSLEPLPARVVAAFGGLSKTAKALTKVAHRRVPISTVDSWVRAGKFPDWRIRDIRAASTQENVELPHDFPAESAA